MDWLTIIEDFLAAIEHERLHLQFQARLAGARMR
jgi:hypothetical protein